MHFTAHRPLRPRMHPPRAADARAGPASGQMVPRRFASDPTTEALAVKITHTLSSATRNLSPATPVHIR
jgi:hypothetical protein